MESNDPSSAQPYSGLLRPKGTVSDNTECAARQHPGGDDRSNVEGTGHSARIRGVCNRGPHCGELEELIPGTVIRCFTPREHMGANDSPSTDPHIRMLRPQCFDPSNASATLQRPTGMRTRLGRENESKGRRGIESLPLASST